MYRMPEKQTGCGMVLKCAQRCFLSVFKSRTLLLTFHQTEIWRFYHFLICFLSFYIIFVLAEFFYMPWWFIYILLHLHLCKLPFMWRISLETKMLLWFPRCLPLWAPFLFWLSSFYKLSFSLFISTFWCGKVMRNAVTD